MQRRYGVIREMDKPVVHVLGVVVEDGEPHVALLIVPDYEGVEVGDQHPLPDVEFALADDQRVLDVFLGHPQGLFGFYVVFDLDEVVVARYAAAAG
jgi:hypothetical protein